MLSILSRYEMFWLASKNQFSIATILLRIWRLFQKPLTRICWFFNILQLLFAKKSKRSFITICDSSSFFRIMVHSCNTCKLLNEWLEIRNDIGEHILFTSLRHPVTWVWPFYLVSTASLYYKYLLMMWPPLGSTQYLYDVAWWSTLSSFFFCARVKIFMNEIAGSTTKLAFSRV